MALLFVLLIARGTGIYPVVMADEWVYSSDSRLRPFSQAGVPSYLYLLLYRSTNMCGDGFLDCARILNSLFMVTAIPFIYRVGRLVCGPLLACFIAALAVLGPINSYAIYFMPEAMYFMGFWVLTWLVLTRDRWPVLARAMVTGFAAGLLGLVKIHALFLLPALIAYSACIPWLRRDARSWRVALQAGIAIGLAFFATRLFIGYLIAGRSGLSLFGVIYGSEANGAGASTAKRAAELAPIALFSLKGHLMALAVLFAVPLGSLITGLRLKERTQPDVDAPVRIRLYTLLVFAALLGVVALFTASAGTSGRPLESAARLHMRYYNFALPLLLCVAAAEFKTQPHFGWLRALVAGILGLVTLYAITHLLSAYVPSAVDSPELGGVAHSRRLFTAIGALAIVATFAWGARPKWGATLFLFVLAPVVALAGSWQVNKDVRQRQTPDVYDKAGVLVRRYLGSEVAHMTVIAPQPAPLVRAMFHLDNVNVATRQEEEGTELSVEQLPDGTAWLLVIGNYKLGEGLRSTVDFDSFSLVQVVRERFIDFRSDRWPSVTRSSGLSWAEPWGRWTDRRNLEIEFSTTLPTHFELTLTGHAFGENGTFVVRVGNAAREYKLPTHGEGRSSAVFLTDGNERIVSISVPHPVAPKDLGLGEDPRELGLGLGELAIKAIR
ncbi:DUF7024 domain-containing protein [Ramlibacter sp. MMS24-I3-19]|uniref:ArnT family glycosyltransferase n=1 Tax=Ramlibacter sp. MMS24-I3-19 TaxID=3416606 RepID=UPI003CFF8B76